MDQFIEVFHPKLGRMLLLRHEFAGGEVISEKVIRGREKLEKAGSIEVIHSENDFHKGEARKIHRKGHLG